MNYVWHYMKQLSSFSGARLYFNLFGMVVISLLDGLGILLLVPMLSISGLISVNMGINPITESLSFLKNFNTSTALLLALAIFISISIVQNVLQRGFMIQNVNIHQNFTHYLRLRTYRKLLSADWNFYLNRRKSDLINMLTTEMPRVNSGVYLFMQAITSFLFTIIQIGIAFWLSPLITVFVVICGAALALFSRKFSKKAFVLGNHTVDTSEKYLAGITDLFNGIKEVKSNRLENSRLQWVHQLSEKLQYEQEAFNKLRSTSQLVYRLSSVALIATLLYLSIVFFRSQPEQLLIIIVIFSRLWPRFMSMQNNLEQVSAFIPAFKKLIELEQQSELAQEEQAAYVPSKLRPLKLKEGITCSDVYFRYESAGQQYALQDINLHIPANQMTAIVGRSGAGKSTLVDLLMGLIKPEEGQILIDGQPLGGEEFQSLKRSISYVPQDPFLFHASIRDNLLLFEPNASEEEIWEALEYSAAAAFISKLPQGLDTFIGDRGIKLSGGERQRLVLGRALLRKPSVLILDEATSALDNENETIIQEVLHRLKGKTTILVIAHRFTTIRNSDQVLVLDQGRIVQTGQYSQLAQEKRGVFKKLLSEEKDIEFIQPSEV